MSVVRGVHPLQARDKRDIPWKRKFAQLYEQACKSASRVVHPNTIHTVATLHSSTGHSAKQNIVQENKNLIEHASCFCKY
jgi:hypothetical protein